LIIDSIGGVAIPMQLRDDGVLGDWRKSGNQSRNAKFLWRRARQNAAANGKLPLTALGPTAMQLQSFCNAPATSSSAVSGLQSRYQAARRSATSSGGSAGGVNASQEHVSMRE